MGRGDGGGGEEIRPKIEGKRRIIFANNAAKSATTLPRSHSHIHRPTNTHSFAKLASLEIFINNLPSWVTSPGPASPSYINHKAVRGVEQDGEGEEGERRRERRGRGIEGEGEERESEEGG